MKLIFEKHFKLLNVIILFAPLDAWAQHINWFKLSKGNNM